MAERKLRLDNQSSSSYGRHLLHGRLDRSWAEGLSFYHHRPPNCLGQMLTAMEFSQHLVSSSKTVRPDIPRGARCVGQCEIMWSAVCSVAPHSQFGEGARPHLCMDDLKRPTPERRRLSLTQAVLGKLIPRGLALTLGMKAWSADILLEYSMSHFAFVHWAARTPISDRLSSSFRAAGTNGRLDFSLSLRASCDPYN